MTSLPPSRILATSRRMTRRPSLSSPPPMMMSGPLDRFFTRSDMISNALLGSAPDGRGRRIDGIQAVSGETVRSPHGSRLVGFAASCTFAPGAGLLVELFDLDGETRFGRAAKIEHLPPHGLHVGRREHHQIAGPGAPQAQVRGFILVENAADPLLGEPGCESALGQQGHDL